MTGRNKSSDPPKDTALDTSRLTKAVTRKALTAPIASTAASRARTVSGSSVPLASRPPAANATIRTSPPIANKPLAPAARKIGAATGVANTTTAATRARASTGSSTTIAGAPTTVATRLARTTQPNVRKPLPAAPAGSTAKGLDVKHSAELQSKISEVESLKTEKKDIEEKVSVRVQILGLFG